MTDAAVEYAALLREVHALIAAGLGDTPEHDAILDRMDAPWGRMTQAERAQMVRFSIDLYDGGEVEWPSA